MAWPTYEDITREVIARLQVALGANADCYGAGGAQALEVTATDGGVVRESYAKPKLAVMGPRIDDAVNTPQPGPGARVLVSADTDDLTYVDAPAPQRVNLTFTLTGYATSEHTMSGRKGLLWLMDAVDLFTSRRTGDSVIWNASWPKDSSLTWGYHFGGTRCQRMPAAEGLHAFSASLTVYRACRAPDERGAGYLVGSPATTGGVELDLRIDP